VRRLTANEHLTAEFATRWPEYDLDAKTRALLAYATKLTETPAQIEDADIAALLAAGWDDEGVYEATVLVGLYNCTGRLEAASGLPPDRPPAGRSFAEATP
jgi:alkylhydroperoxidase family enzyme